MEPLNRRDAIKTFGLGAAAFAGASALSSTASAQEEGGEEAKGAIDGKPGDIPESEIAYKDGNYVLPPLPYDYNALEPSIDEQTMRLHHDIHHQGYVNGANKAAEMLNSIAAGGEDSYVQYWEHKLAFNVSGHALHTMFWNNMKPDGGGDPSGPLAEGLTKDFGSYENFKRLFQASAGAVEGSGWAILGYDMLSRKLMVYQAGKHMNLNVQSAAPLLVIDVWEHAYYLKYQNKRGEYIDAFFNVINWDDVARRYSVYTHPQAS